MALSDTYIIEALMLGKIYDNTERWKLLVVERNTNEQAVTIVRLRKKDNAPVVSAPSCLQQFSFESFFTRKNSTSQQMTLWWQLGPDLSVSTHSGPQNASQETSLATTSYKDGLG